MVRCCWLQLVCCLRTVDGAFRGLGEMNVSSQELQAAMGEVSLAGIDSSKILQTLSSYKAEHTEENKRLVEAFKNLAARARSEGKPAGRLNESLFSSLKKSVTKSLKRFPTPTNDTHEKLPQGSSKTFWC